MFMLEDSIIGLSDDVVIDGKVWVKGIIEEMLDIFLKLIFKKEDIFVCIFLRLGL